MTHTNGTQKAKQLSVGVFVMELEIPGICASSRPRTGQSMMNSELEVGASGKDFTCSSCVKHIFLEVDEMPFQDWLSWNGLIYLVL